MIRARQALIGLIAVCTAHTAVVLTMSCIHADDLEYRLMPAAGGAIETLALQFHADGSDDILQVFGALLTELNPQTRVVLTVTSANDIAIFDAAMSEWFVDLPAPQIQYVQTDIPITSWARDRLAVIVDQYNEPQLIAPPEPMKGAPARINDWTVPFTLGTALGLPTAVADFGFEGGDLIGSTTHVFTAPVLMERNPGRTPDEMSALVGRRTGLEVVALDHAPSHHIGMFLTPLGNGRVMVGDPDLALDLIGADRLDIAGHFALDRDESHLDSFRAVAKQLESEGFEVIGVPILPGQQPYAFVSYNNVVLEVRDDGVLHVLLPTYGEPTLDAAAIEIWQGVGAEVHPIDVSKIFRLGGSVRCLTAPLRRDALPAARRRAP